MALQDLNSLADLCDVGRGVASAMWSEELEKIVRDLEAHPGSQGKRELTLTVRFVPNIGQKGPAGDIDVEIEVKGKLPASRSPLYAMRIAMGKVTFSTDRPDNLNQGTLGEEAARANEERQDSDAT